jgi:hypothetical protein
MPISAEAEEARKGASAGVARGQRSEFGGDLGLVLSGRQLDRKSVV